jgi:ubiquinone/menaquinone biosynthesis C-methylase UbiE
MERYHPESYWNEVAERVAGRNKGNFVAGDDEPFYRYKRKKFLQIFHTIDFRNRSVLEVGPGPGGNLGEVLKHHPKSLYGADISLKMLELAEENLTGAPVKLFIVSNGVLPFEDQSMDIVFTSTVLQHTTDQQSLMKTISEICRVSASEVYIFERIESKKKGHPSCLGRTVQEYSELFGAHHFDLKQTRFLNIQASYLVSGAIRKIFNKRNRKEGEQHSLAAFVLQKISLPFTSLLDKLVRVERDLAMLHFQKARI